MKPITRKEKLIAGEELTPITREEMFLKKYGGGASSWNDLTDRPFYEETTTVNEPLKITWDGNTDGLTVAEHRTGVEDGAAFEYGFYKVSDVVLTDEQFRSASYIDFSVYIESGEITEQEGGEVIDGYWDIYSDTITDTYALVNAILIVKKPSEQYPECGIYFRRVDYSAEDGSWSEHSFAKSFITTEPIEHEKTTIKKIDEKYLPSCVTKFYVLQGDDYIHTSSSASEESRAHSSDIYGAITRGTIVVYSVYEDGNIRFIAYPTSIEPGLSGCWITVANSYNTYGYHTSDWEANVS